MCVYWCTKVALSSAEAPYGSPRAAVFLSPQAQGQQQQQHERGLCGGESQSGTSICLTHSELCIILGGCEH